MAAQDPLARARAALADLSSALDDLETEEQGEGENEPEAGASEEAPAPAVRVALPWRGRAGSKKPSARGK